jgi:hypothetical protein
MLGWIAMGMAITSLVSGLLAVGSGKQWGYSLRDLLFLRLDALLYVGVVFTTIWSIYHATMLGIYASSSRAEEIGPAMHIAWMTMHIAISTFLVMLHAYVGLTLRDPVIVACLKTHLWGRANEP